MINISYSSEALSFSKIPVDHQVRFSDRVSFLYLEFCSITQDETGVIARRQYQDGEVSDEILEIPVAGLAVLFLGPGTSITQPAIASCARAGATVIFSGRDGLPYYSHATPLTTSDRWAMAQARCVSTETSRRRAARYLYAQQLGIDFDEKLSIRQMRGLEGQLIKQKYRALSRQYGVKNFKRDVKSEDSINATLNMVNGILYGCAASAASAMGINPALGVIHRGDARSLLFDIADLYKPTISIPLAFRVAHEGDALPLARRELRNIITQKRLLEDMVAQLTGLFSPYVEQDRGDRLVNDYRDVSGHKNYGKED